MQDGNVSPLRAFFRNKWVLSILVIDIIVIFIVVGILIWQTTKVSTISFNIVPYDATISVNGNTSYTNGEYIITPGVYEIEISHEGLNTKSFRLDFEPHDNIVLTTFLSDSNDFEFYKLKENYESFRELSEIASAEDNKTSDDDESAEEFIDSFEKIISISEILPIDHMVFNEDDVSSSPFFAIDIDEDCKYYNLCLIVSPVLNTTHEEVLEFIREQGYTPENYEIKFKDRIEL